MSDIDTTSIKTKYATAEMLAQLRDAYRHNNDLHLIQNNKPTYSYTDYKCEQCGGLERVRDDYQGALRCSTCGGGLLPIKSEFRSAGMVRIDRMDFEANASDLFTINSNKLL